MIEGEQLNAPAVTTHPSASWGSRVSRYGPLVAWAVLIFIGSGNVLSAEHTSIVLPILKWLFPSASRQSLATAHFLIRKAGHLTEYAILASLAARAFRHSWHQALRSHWFWLSLLFAIAYSLSDEFHQSFIPSRTASIYDCMIDTTGGLIGLAIVGWWNRRRTEKKRGVLTGLQQTPQLDSNGEAFVGPP
jgi:VanZ family protein